jgi:hypothetical protein
MELTLAAPTATWPLAAVIEHIANHPNINGVMQIGSLTTTTFNPTSDYDLVIVLREMPVPWYVGITSIDHRFTDLLFVSPAALECIIALSAPIPLSDTLTPIIRWLQTGQILFDRSDRLAKAQNHVRSAQWIAPVPDKDVYGAWFATNYNLAQARRMLSAHTALYQMTVDIRMALHGHMDVWYSYFTIRRIADTGEKDAIRHLLAHDPDFLSEYRQFIHETDLNAKFARYEKVAALALAPVGDLWTADTTAMNEDLTLARWTSLFEMKA